MFNFHKPRTYRSAEGCCICRAKSSSSRFTDSRKYERDTMQCFDLKYPRQGEICNACVLLVKRYKRLPVDSKRNWSHVVDARAGPGGSKIQTKYKSERISSRSHQQSSSNNSTSLVSPTSSSSCVSHSSAGGSPNSTVHGHPMSFLPEKFSKIFKKSKKVKDSSSSSSLSSSHYSSNKRKSSSNGWTSHNGLHSLPSTPDSLDSDYEDSRMHSSLVGCGPGSGTVVHFQTQTRASAFRAQAAAEARRRTLKLGSKRRKCLQPRKNRRTTTFEETLQFFDEEEWREQKSCCGMLYECPALGGALIVDVANYKPCEKHQQIPTTANATIELQSQSSMPLVMAPQRPTIHHSIPAVVQLQPPAAPTTATLAMMTGGACSNSSLPSSIILGTTSTPSALTITKSSPALKKHHLFFKRQSECFPQGDMVTPSETTTSYSSPSNPVNTTKTESDYNNRTQHQLQHHLQPQPHQQYKLQHPHHQSTTIFQRHNEHAIHSSAASSNYATVSSSGALSISVTSVTAAPSSLSSPMPMSNIPSSASLFTSTMPQMPKHSLAKVTTISPPLTASHTTINTTMPLSKPHSFLHKIKADTGKIVKHSLEKFNTAVRLKTNDLHDMKPIIKTVDKSYILAKPPTMANINTLNAAAAAAATTYQTLSTYNSAAQPPLTTASLSAASPTSSTSSTSSTKFSDNSSDSGFDENMLDRKSASPLQEDCEKKLLSRPGVQTMFLASGVQIQGQPQNLVLTGNEVAAKILQNRKYSSITTTPVTSNTRALSTNHHPTTTPVKIAQISTGSGVVGSHHTGSSSSVMSSAAAQAKMRAIYNNSNTIQHENGITTIVPASSLAATTQTAAMQNIAPSTVTITPAPPAGNTQYNGQNIISRKLTTANIINLQSNNLSNTTTNNTASNLNGSNGGNHFNSATAANQKIILLKTPSSANNNGMASTPSSSSSTLASSTATVTKYSGR